MDSLKKTFHGAMEKAENIQGKCKEKGKGFASELQEKIVGSEVANKDVSIRKIVDKVKDRLHKENQRKVSTGQDFKQLLDNSNPHVHTEILGKYGMGKRVGRIQFTEGGAVGTGFIVGSMYVMTAYHVMRDNLKMLWDTVKDLPKEEKDEIGWTTDDVPETSWNISSLFSSDPKSKGKIMELVNLVTGLYEIKFEFLKEFDVGSIVKFKPDIAFASPEYDVLVLELEDYKFELKCLGLVEDNARNEKLHVFGHPSGKPLQHDPACTILKEDTDLSELKKEGIAFFKKECKSLEEKDIEESYSPCVISKDKILFHSSCSTAHGASGAPLIIVCDGSPKVYGMLLCGHPGIFYNSFNGRLKRLDLLVESGISMKKVRSLLKSFKPKLEQDLFRDV